MSEYERLTKSCEDRLRVVELSHRLSNIQLPLGSILDTTRPYASYGLIISEIMEFYGGQCIGFQLTVLVMIQGVRVL